MAAWDGSKVTVAEDAGMHGHCHASVDQEPRRGKQDSRWTMETTTVSVAPQQFLRLGQATLKYWHWRRWEWGPQHPRAQAEHWVILSSHPPGS